MLDLKKYRTNFQGENEAGNKTGSETRNKTGSETRNKTGGETGKMNKLCRGVKKIKNEMQE
ncbi:hypothetical protein ACSAZL_21125 [Methanosarcina sp. T3]|uniref:hypothetical protein n=1 Tax=Methanosarcina sp. T3 TaxID=3439062 RepID=UPI003F871059